jgi:hypothetical protein
MSLSDSEYFQRRAGEERLAAERTSNGSAREAHLELAKRYEIAAAANGNGVAALEPGGPGGR